MPPDSSAGEFGFDFTRFGVRVPAVLVSPLIAPGAVFRPTGTVPLDHTSIVKTVESRWGLPPLTARDAAAPDVGDVLSLAQPRTDDPLAGVSVPASRIANPVAGTPSHIQQVYAQLVSALPVNDTQGRSTTGCPRWKPSRITTTTSGHARRRGQRPGPPHRRRGCHTLAPLFGDRDDRWLAGQQWGPQP